MQLWDASMMLVTALQDNFLPQGAPDQEAQPDAQTQDRWRARYRAAARRLQQAGIETNADELAGAEAYVSCRRQWDHHITNLAPSMAYRMEEIDVAMSRLSASTAGRPIPAAPSPLPQTC